MAFRTLRINHWFKQCGPVSAKDRICVLAPESATDVDADVIVAHDDVARCEA